LDAIAGIYLDSQDDWFCFILLHFVYALIIARNPREVNILFFVYA